MSLSDQEKTDVRRHCGYPVRVATSAGGQSWGLFQQVGQLEQARTQRGKVLAVGPGRLLDSGERVAISVVVGDEVLFSKYGGTDIEVDGQEVKILRESDILAKIVK